MTESAPSTSGVVIIATDGALDAVAAALSAEGIETQLVDSAQSVSDFMATHTHTIAVLDTAIPQAEAFQVYKILRQNQVIPTLILVPSETYRTYLLDPLRGPNEEYIAKPVRVDEAILRVKALMVHAGIQPPAVTREPPSGGVAVATAPHGKVVSIFHAKGGVGASTIATNLAVGLAIHRRSRTLLVDADLWFGDLGVLLDLPPQQSPFEMLLGSDFDEGELRRRLIQHPTGIRLLPRPEDPSVAERLDPSLVSKAIAACRTAFDYLVIDLAPTLAESTLELLDLSEQILLVTTPELTAVHNSARFLKIAEAIGYSDRISIILNRASSGIPTEALEHHLNIGARVQLPSAGRLVVDAANRGVPLLATEDPWGRDELTRLLMEIVDLVAPLSTDAKTTTPPEPEVARARTGRFFWR